MADINTPVEFITEAQEAILQYEKANEEKERDEKAKRDTEQKLNYTVKRLENEKNQAITNKRKEIDSEYSKKIRQVEEEINTINRNKAAAREKAVKERTQRETKPQKDRIEQLKKDFDNILTKDNVPWYAKNKAFFLVFYPNGLLETLCSVCAFLLFFILLPIILWKLFLGDDTVSFIVLNAIIVTIDMVVTVAIFKNTREKHSYAMKAARKDLDEIKKEKEAIRKLTDSISKDNNDEQYNLESFDEAIAEKQQEKEKLENEKANALDVFEKITTGEINTEIENKYKNEIENLKKEFADLAEKITNSNQDIMNKKAELETKYYQHIEQKYLNKEDLERIKGIIQAGEASTIKEAIEKYED